MRYCDNVSYAVVFATPLLKSGIITQSVNLSLKRAAEMLKNKAVYGIVVIGAYSDNREVFVTRKMSNVLMEMGVSFEKIVEVPYHNKNSALESLRQKFTITDENDEIPRRFMFTPVVGSNVSEYFCIKPIEFRGFRIDGSPQEVEVPFSIGSWLESVYYFMDSILVGFTRSRNRIY